MVKLALVISAVNLPNCRDPKNFCVFIECISPFWILTNEFSLDRCPSRIFILFGDERVMFISYRGCFAILLAF